MKDFTFVFSPLVNQQSIAISCSQLRSPINGKVSKGFGSYKEMVSYSCNNAQYRLNGPVERVCQANGQWSGRAPTCERMLKSFFRNEYFINVTIITLCVGFVYYFLKFHHLQNRLNCPVDPNKPDR